MTQRPTLNAGALRDAPALIESVFPAQKVSFEAQRERKANLGQTLTGLGSYWKGRKPLILVRAILLGTLLPQTSDPDADLDLFESLLAFDNESLARRALANNSFSPKVLRELIPIDQPERYFTGSGWRRDIGPTEKLELYRIAIATSVSYEQKAALCKRPEEVDADWLYAHVWPKVNRHYAHLGIQAHSFDQLMEQLGTLRYGRRPRVADTFSGGGSIPFEAARLGCDVYASDLNPIACLLTWGALNVVGAPAHRRVEIERAQQQLLARVDEDITAFGIEHDAAGNRAKAYLYCMEGRCPETGWLVPMSTSWAVSKSRNIVARLRPDHRRRRFDIEIVSGVSDEEMVAADLGTVRDGCLVYELDGVVHRTPIKTLRGDYRLADGTTGNRLRPWLRSDFRPHEDDLYQERLFAIQWITRESLGSTRQETYFAAPSDDDLERERQVERIVATNLERWQAEGLVPDMPIELGHETTRLTRERGWTHWHHVFTPRDYVLLASILRHIEAPELVVAVPSLLNHASKLCQWITSAARRDAAGKQVGGPRELPNHVFYNQAFNTFWNYSSRASTFILKDLQITREVPSVPISTATTVLSRDATSIDVVNDIYITDPPYADAVNYHEITEFFIAWLRRNPPAPFNSWVWDSRRALAIQGSGEDFRRNMVAAYTAMAAHMPDNGMQCVMFTHQDTGVWSDLVGIFWAAGLQVVAAWYIATETTSELKKGGYVQGTVTLMLRKRPAGDRPAFKQRLLPAVRQEVDRQIRTMMHLNTTVKAHHGEPVFNDSDLQMAGYAAALKVLTGYTHIGGEDVTSFALRPRVKGEVTVVDEIVQQAAEAASNLLVPEGLAADTWGKLSGIERFVLRMMDMETTGTRKLDNYQNFAKAFRVQDYARVMASMAPNEARLKQVTEFASRDLTDSTELGATRLGRLVIALQQMRADLEPQTIISQLQAEMPDFLEARPLLVDLLAFVERKAPEADVRTAAEVLGARLKNQRFGI